MTLNSEDIKPVAISIVELCLAKRHPLVSKNKILLNRKF